MLTRVISALIGLAIVVPILVFGGTLGLSILVGVVVVICQMEFVSMSPVGSARWLRVFEIVAGLSIYGLMQLGTPIPLLLAISFSIIATFFAHMATLEPMETSATRWAFTVAGLMYVPFLLGFLPLLRGVDHGLNWIFLVLIITWAGDSGAYFAGRAFGKHKLHEKISPKKTIEGVAGGAVFSVFGALVARATFFPELSVFDCLIIAPIADLVGVAGDLSESLLKRVAGVKDSGNIMPGHGGLLDRVDSLLFSAPVVFGYAVLIFGRF